MCDSSQAPGGSPALFSYKEDFGDDVPKDPFLELVPFGLERLNDYEPGGQHPVHLGDTLGPGRRGPYRVLHKLGNGGYANIWLCRDMTTENSTQYIALKVLVSDMSTVNDSPERRAGILRHGVDEQEAADYLCLPLDEFEIRGPNGTHLCLAYPVLGPTVAQGAFRRSPNLESVLREVGRRTAMAVDLLHRHGICHGGKYSEDSQVQMKSNAKLLLPDITSRNILHRVLGLNGLTEDEVLRVVGTPVRNSVLCGRGEPHNLPAVPQYLVYPVKWLDVDTKHISPESCVIDLGQSFSISQTPDGDDLGTPGPYRSPELILDKAAGVASDLWALGCTLFEVRTGRKLFCLFDDDDDSYLEAMVEVLGKLPEPWWSTGWEARRGMYKDETDEHGRAVAAREEWESPAGLGEGETGIINTVHPSIAEGARSIRDMLAPGLWYLCSKENGGDFHRDISEEEKEAIADLLGRLLEYDPAVRLQARDVIHHRWFSF